MPTVAQTPRARVICGSCHAGASLATPPACDASRAPDTPQPPGHRACVRCEQGAGHAAAPWTPRLRAMRAGRRCRRCPLATPPACDASRAPVPPLPPGHRAAVDTARPPQSTAHAFVSAMFKNSTAARQGASGAQAHSPAPLTRAQAHVHSQRASPVSHGLPARARASSLRRWARVRCASCRLLARAHRSRRPRKSAALRCASSGRGLFGRGAPCWRTLRAAPSRFAR